MTTMSIQLPAVRATPVAGLSGVKTSLPRVLYAVALDPDKKFGSLEEQITFLARRFQAEESLFLPLFVCAPGPGKLDQFHERGVEAECLDLRRFHGASLPRLLRLLKEYRIEVVHWNFTSPLRNSYVWWLSLLRPRVAHYFTDHNSRWFPLPAPPRGVKAALARPLLARYRKVFCVSRFVQDCLEGQGIWSNLLHFRHFVNTDRFQPDASTRTRLRADLGAADRFVILMVGQLIKAKGADVLLRALAKLPARAVLWLIGEGEEQGALARLAAELGLEGRVRFLGLQRNVQPYMQAADCFVCPSLWAEAAGLVVLEAAASGLPVLASRIGGIPEYVEEDQGGLLFEPGNHGELSSLLLRLLEDPELCGRMGERGRLRAVQLFSPQAALPNVLDLYRR
jgi:glycosyltransferase involved in cell wall biosynthesis